MTLVTRARSGLGRRGASGRRASLRRPPAVEDCRWGRLRGWVRRGRAPPWTIFTILHDDGITEIVWRAGIVIRPAELDVLANTITYVPRCQSRPLLVHLDLVRHITPAVRGMLASYRHHGPIGLTGSGPKDRVLAAFIAQSRSRTRYFAETADARAWLSSILMKAGTPAMNPIWVC